MVYKAQAYNKDFFVKIIKGTHSNVSIAIMKLLQAMGLKHIISPIKALTGQSMQYVDGFTLIVYPFIAGENGFDKALTEEQWQILGQEVRRLHDIKVPNSFQKQLKYETYSPKFRDDVKLLYANLHTHIVSDAISLAFMECLKQNSKKIHRLVIRADQLAQSLKDTSAQFVLCHADIHGRNVVIDKNNVIYIVDWDSPMMAPKERDLMFIGGGVANVWNKPNEESLFYKGYGKTEVNRTILAYYRHERIVEDIAGFAESILFTGFSEEAKLENYKHFVAMFKPNGVLDIAFRTDSYKI